MNMRVFGLASSCFLAFASASALAPSIALAQDTGAPVVEELSPDQRYKALEAIRKDARTPAQMQEAIAGYQALADLGHARSAFRLGNIFYRGTMVKADEARGIENYRKAAEAGYDQAWRYLGNSLLDVGQGEAALHAFEQARAAGVTGFELNEAKAHLRRRFGSLSDPKAGLEALQTLSAAGDEKAQMELAKTYADPRSGFADYGAAREVLEGLVAIGDANAMSRLAGLYKSGLGVKRSYPKATELYLQAVEAGYDVAVLSAVDMLSRRGKWTEAYDRLTQAVENRVDYAEVALADAHIRRLVGPHSDRALGRQLIAEGIERKDLRFVILALDLYADWQKPGVDPALLIEEAKAAADTGNGDAAAALLRVSRARPKLVDGLGKSRVELLAGYGDTLRASTKIEEEVRLIIDKNPISKARQLLLEKMAEADDIDHYNMLVATSRADRNIYIYLVQRHLADAGKFRGRANGYLTTGTLNSMLRFCGENGYRDECKHGPLRGTAVRLMSASLALNES